MPRQRYQGEDPIDDPGPSKDPVSGAREMVQFLPWPFADGRFPANLGAVVQRTVLDGSMPALIVEHDADGGWAIADGVNDPNEDGACIATHIWHAIEHNGSIGSLAGLSPGHQAHRRWPGDVWTIDPFDPRAAGD